MPSGSLGAHLAASGSHLEDVRGLWCSAWQQRQLIATMAMRSLIYSLAASGSKPGRMLTCISANLFMAITAALPGTSWQSHQPAQGNCGPGPGQCSLSPPHSSPGIRWHSHMLTAAITHSHPDCLGTCSWRPSCEAASPHASFDRQSCTVLLSSSLPAAGLVHVSIVCYSLCVHLKCPKCRATFTSSAVSLEV